MFYENGKPKGADAKGESFNLSEVDKLIKSSNAELLASILQQLKNSSYSPSGANSREEEDFSKDTIEQLAKMMGEKREEGSQDIGKKIEIESNLEKDKETVDLLRSLD